VPLALFWTVIRAISSSLIFLNSIAKIDFAIVIEIDDNTALRDWAAG
jgi:hypothetical protein